MAQTESENISKKVIIKTFLEQKLGTIFNQKQILTYIFLNLSIRLDGFLESCGRIFKV